MKINQQVKKSVGKKLSLQPSCLGYCDPPRQTYRQGEEALQDHSVWAQLLPKSLAEYYAKQA